MYAAPTLALTMHLMKGFSACTCWNLSCLLGARRLAHHDVSPMTGAPLHDKSLRPNLMVRSLLARARSTGALG